MRLDEYAVCIHKDSKRFSVSNTAKEKKKMPGTNQALIWFMPAGTWR